MGTSSLLSVSVEHSEVGPLFATLYLSNVPWRSVFTAHCNSLSQSKSMHLSLLGVPFLSPSLPQACIPKEGVSILTFISGSVF